MKKIKNILFLTLLFFPLILSLSSCDNTSPKKIEKKQNVVVKKIINQPQKINPAQKKEAEDKKIDETKVQQKSQNQKIDKKEVKPEVKVSQKDENKKEYTVDIQQKSLNKEVGKTKAQFKKKSKKIDKKENTLKEKQENEQNSDSQKKLTDKEELAKNEKLKDELENDRKKNKAYIAKKNIDPFASPIAKRNQKTKKKINNRKLSPLEKLDISQLKLVAVINLQSGKKSVAMVEESNGKGYMVKIGTYIGQNFGRIIEIRNAEILIKERIKNFKGDFEEIIKKMKLQKKDNG